MNRVLRLEDCFRNQAGDDVDDPVLCRIASIVYEAEFDGEAYDPPEADCSTSSFKRGPVRTRTTASSS